MSWFSTVAPLPPDPVLGLSEAFKADPRQEKLDLTAGTYRDENLKPVIFQAVKKAEEQVFEAETNKEYLPLAGDPLFLNRIGELAFGSANWTRYQTQIASLQTAGGTGALRIGGEFLKMICQAPLYTPIPTWPNHRHVMHQSGFTVESYPYYDAQHHKVQFDKLYKYCEKLAPSSVLLLHLSCHNPTGCDLSLEEWKALSKLMRKKKLFPFLDCAYQGFGEGLEKDMQPLSFFIEDGHEFAMAYSCAKNFSVYCERVGALFVFTKQESISKTVLSILKMKSRGIISNAPAHGARIVARILDTPSLREMWQQELEKVHRRILDVRQQLASALGEEYAFIRQGKGLFCITGLHAKQIERLREEYGIYMTLDGRINLAGLNSQAIGLLAEAMRKVYV